MCATLRCSLSAIRQEKDNKGNDCDTHDFVIATDTYARCKQTTFRDFIVSTAIENVQKQRYVHTHGARCMMRWCMVAGEVNG